MKKLTSSFLLILILVIVIVSCRGPEGAPGPQGLPGEGGQPAPLALMYEPKVNLNSSNNWSFTYPFPLKDISNIHPDDVVLAYIFNGTTVQNSISLDIWQPLPLVSFNTRGTYQIGYDFTANDVHFFVEANYALSQLDDINNQDVRIVVVPAEYSINQRKAPVNFKNYYEVLQAYNIKDIPLK